MNRRERRMAKSEDRAPRRGASPSVQGLFGEAVRHHHASRLAEAERVCRQILAIDPGHADSLHLLGVLAHLAGRHETAAELIEQAIRLRSDVPVYHNNLGLALQARARLDQAVVCFERAIAIKPDFVKAHNNLGVVLLAQGKLAAAVAYFERALALEPNHGAARVNMGNALTALGKLDAAVAHFERALAFEPNLAEAHHNLGVALMRLGRIDAAFAAYRRHAALRAGKAGPAGGQARNGGPPVPPHKATHDRGQLDYLIGARPERADFRQAREAAAQAPERFAATFDKLFHLEGGVPCAPAAVNPAIDAARIEAEWERSRPNIVVVDDFLAPSALEELRRFCWGSTVWRDSYANGYLGAFLGDGFACPLLGQIASGLAAKLPRIVRHRPLTQLWAFKYDSERSGITVHADAAAVNVNFWITADDANLDPNSGGLVIWDVPAPLDWAFDRYQNNDPRDIRKFLDDRHATAVVVPYRCNRAVIFDSDLFHETDRFTFKEGYLNRRINITMLYGLRHDEGAF